MRLAASQLRLRISFKQNLFLDSEIQSSSLHLTLKLICVTISMSGNMSSHYQSYGSNVTPGMSPVQMNAAAAAHAAAQISSARYPG